MLAESYYPDPDDRAVARLARDNGKGPGSDEPMPRFVYRIRGPLWIYTDTLTGEELEVHGAELWRAGEWKDSILAGERRLKVA